MNIMSKVENENEIHCVAELLMLLYTYSHLLYAWKYTYVVCESIDKRTVLQCNQ